MNLNIRSIFLMSQQIGKRSMIPMARAHHQRGLDRGPERLGDVGSSPTAPARRGGQLHAHAGRRVGRHGITVNALAPGFFPSKMTKGTIERFGADKMARAAPLRRIGDDDDLRARRCCFVRRGQTHHRADPGHRRRRQRRAPRRMKRA